MNSLRNFRRNRYRKSTLIIYWSVRIITLTLLGYSLVGMFLRRSDDSQSSDFGFIAANALSLFIA